ncbi:LAFE_0H10550g1_1 [Lachancea fermentati]|uniref:LAFE_0H10550g1_1 n=1 Tax=Lachancea fermentati TaxID=4955 RepID=A0A1G4MK88_LACFM|nr:LAFE_0H10550g1_1 [Lachancea fermentati]
MHNNGHIVHQEGETLYYVTLLFKYSQTATITVPCFIRDVLMHYSRSVTAIKRYYPRDTAFWFFNNHPIDSVMVLGCVAGWKWKFIGDSDYAIFHLDDCTVLPDQVTLLKCKCSKSLLMRSGLPLGDLSGWTLRVRGRMNDYEELEVDLLEICGDLLAEIEFWKECFKVKRLLDKPWILDDSVSSLLSTQDDGRPLQYGTFVECLERKQFKNDLELASPYCSEDDTSYSNEIIFPIDEEVGCLESDLDQSHLMEFGVSESPKTLIVANEDSVVNQRQRISELTLADNSMSGRSQLAKREISKGHNSKYYGQQFLKYLLHQKFTEISTMNTYRNATLNGILTSAATNKSESRLHQGSEALEDVKMMLFNEVLQRLASMELISLFERQKLINIKNLKSCFNYISERISTVVKLGCYTGKIDYRHIRDALGYRNLTNYVILELYKEALRHFFASTHQSNVRWWIDLNNEEVSFIHFEYG